MGHYQAFRTESMIDMLSPAASGASAFLGTWLAWYLWCPNRRCCQMKTVRGVLEKPRQEE